MSYCVALLIDPYRGIYKIVDTASDYFEAWRRAGAARQQSESGIFYVMSTETREDPKQPRRQTRPVRADIRK